MAVCSGLYAKYPHPRSRSQSPEPSTQCLDEADHALGALDHVAGLQTVDLRCGLWTPQKSPNKARFRRSNQV